MTGGSVNSAPAIAADGTVYIYSHDGYLYALRPDGSLRWSYNVGLGWRSPTPAVGSDGTIYCGTALTLCAIHPDGSLKWARSTSLGDEVSTSPAVAVDGTVYVPATDGFYALNPDSTLRWSFTMTGPNFNSSPAISSDGTIYFGSYFLFYALRPDGSVKWNYTRGLGTLSSPSIGYDGTVYFTSVDGYLHAFRGTSPLADAPWPKFHHDPQNTGRTDQGGWSRLRMVGQPMVDPHGTGFVIQIANEGTESVSINSLEFLSTSAPVYMRSYKIDVQPTQYLSPSDPGIGPGDSVSFTQVTIAPDMVQLVDLYLADFRVGPQVVDPLAPVSGRTFVLRFSDGSVITVTP